MTPLHVGLLFGGRSGEHEVSITSAKAIATAFQSGENPQKYHLHPVYIQKDGLWRDGDTAGRVLADGKPLAVNRGMAARRWQFPPSIADIDVWFPIIHGPNGEDGTLQGLLQLMDVPFVGTGVLGSAVGMDKLMMKTAFASIGLPQVNYRAVRRDEVWSNPCVFPKLCDRLEAELGYPCFVKPANLGSSVGIAKAKSRRELEAALDSAARYDRRMIVERGVQARELECAVLGNDNPEVSVVGEIAYDSDFYDYETKYTAGKANLVIPAPISDAVANRIRELAIQGFLCIDCAGLARMDFFYLEETDEVLINEVNTLPGFTALSMYPQLWAATGVPLPQLVDRSIQLALERQHSGQVTSNE